MSPGPTVTATPPKSSIPAPAWASASRTTARHPLHMRPARDLRDHAAVSLVDGVLRMHHVREHLPAPPTARRRPSRRRRIRWQAAAPDPAVGRFGRLAGARRAASSPARPPRCRSSSACGRPRREAPFLVEAPAPRVSRPHLQEHRRPASSAARTKAPSSRAGHAPPPRPRGDGQVHEMPGVRIAAPDQEPRHLPALGVGHSRQLRSCSSSSSNISRVQGKENDWRSMASTAGTSPRRIFAGRWTSSPSLSLPAGVGPGVSHLGDVDVGVGRADVDGLHRLGASRLPLQPEIDPPPAAAGKRSVDPGPRRNPPIPSPGSRSRSCPATRYSARTSSGSSAVLGQPPPAASDKPSPPARRSSSSPAAGVARRRPGLAAHSNAPRSTTASGLGSRTYAGPPPRPPVDAVEHLAPARVHDRERSGPARLASRLRRSHDADRRFGRERAQSAHADHRHVQSQGQAPAPSPRRSSPR